ncbi:MAG: hypothetical protein A6F71_09450 [Cycloclasticus sp. symbiont of Poecilosclerida sp. M]|nr:MAG: hypothetical protein A6F71_09450 [Cycloclasticus sp. symbiont of Poecilosclerida sp. M]
MPQNKKPRNKKYAFSGKQQRMSNPKKILEQFHTQIGQLYRQQQIQEALNLSQQALQKFPNDINLLKNAGAFAGMVDNRILLEKYTLQALKINPDDADAHNNLALLLAEQKQFEKAIEHYQLALEITPNLADVHNNLAVSLVEQKQFEKAHQHYQTALKINPNYISPQWNLSLLQLTQCNFTQGWQNYESRYHKDHKGHKLTGTTPPKTSIPHYQGKDLKGKSLLIYHEQGFGDVIQFIRYLPLLKIQKGVANIALVCNLSLKKLFSTTDCIDHLLDEDEFNRGNLQGMDYWIFIASLPLHFNTTLETIPNQLPYLSSPQTDQNNWQSKLPQNLNNSFNIGLVWKGRAAHANDRNRSLPSIQILKPLWQLAEHRKKNNQSQLSFISLQKGNGEAIKPPPDQPLIHLGNQIQDFADTAAIVSQLDLVICVDTAIAHLTGSLNIPCWVLLPDCGTDWRWMLDRTDSPWYPNTMKLFRQQTDGDWDGVVAEVCKALSDLNIPMPQNTKPRNKKDAFSGKQQRMSNPRKTSTQR